METEIAKEPAKEDSGRNVFQFEYKTQEDTERTVLQD